MGGVLRTRMRNAVYTSRKDVAMSRRAAAGRAQLLAKRGRTGRMQFPEKTAGIRDGSGWFGILEEKRTILQILRNFGEIPMKFR